MDRAQEPALDAQLDWLYAQQRFGVRPGLERVSALLERLGHPEREFRVVLVGGTNGKGSVAATLATILQATGQRTGLFTSPHLTHFAERFAVDGRCVDQAELTDALAEVRPYAEELEATFFEIVTALGCVLFARAGVSWAVMEVGLGGRLDATNVLSPELSVITSVGLDHTEVLGTTLEAIAEEKAGILRRDGPAVTGVSAQLWPVLERRQADLWALGREFEVTVGARTLAGTALELRWPPVAGVESLTVHTPLLGRHGAANAALAAVAALRLGASPDAVQAGVGQTRWPGRLEVLKTLGTVWLLDGAHNPDGAAALASTLRELGLAPAAMIFGASADKDLAEVAARLAPVTAEVMLTQAQLSPRAAAPADLRLLWEKHGVPIRLAPTPAEALALVQPGPARRPMVVCGSLYLVGEIRALLLGDRDEGRERWQ